MNALPILDAVPVRPGPGPDAAYTVQIGRHLAAWMAADLAGRGLAHRYALISDETVLRLHGEALTRALSDAGLRVDVLSFPPGEEHKTRGTVASLVDALVDRGLGRDAAVLALGGGVVGDLAGFVAAIYHRGIPVIQVPTTLLAMVDASVGGKTGHDLPGGKNLVGAFHQPTAVYTDLSFLETLPPTELRAGFAEVIKAALVADAGLVAFLEKAAEALLGLDAGAVARAVVDSIRIKAEVVSGDARESGRRAILNLGHTVGHAVEQASGYRISHGEAVAMGLVAESLLAAGRELLPAAAARRVRDLVDAFGLPTRIPPEIRRDRLWEACLRDKKARAGGARCVLLRDVGVVDPGDGDWTSPVGQEEMMGVLGGG